MKSTEIREEERGQAIIEFILVLPVFLGLVGLLLTVGWLFVDLAGASQATMVAAEAVAQKGGDVAAVESVVENGLVTQDRSLLFLTLHVFDPDTGSERCSETLNGVPDCGTSDIKYGDRVTIEGHYCSTNGAIFARLLGAIGYENVPACDGTGVPAFGLPVRASKIVWRGGAE